MSRAYRSRSSCIVSQLRRQQPQAYRRNLRSQPDRCLIAFAATRRISVAVPRRLLSKNASIGWGSLLSSHSASVIACPLLAGVVENHLVDEQLHVLAAV